MGPIIPVQIFRRGFVRRSSGMFGGGMKGGGGLGGMLGGGRGLGRAGSMLGRLGRGF